MSIVNWNDIKDSYDSLIIGNGASIAVSEKFKYSNLYEKAIELNFVGLDLQTVFKDFNTNDFEVVIRMLSCAKIVSNALSIPDDKVSRSLDSCRNALIQTIQKIHPAYHEIENKLICIASFLKGFNTVISLNYDLILYWAILKGNDIEDGNWLKDCLIHETEDHDKRMEFGWEYLRDSHGNASGATLIFYLHGNLALANHTNENSLETEVKIVDSSSCADYLDAIFEKWKAGRYSPLFVCEGEKKHKLELINKSGYLNAVYTKAFNWSAMELMDTRFYELA